VRDAAVSGHEEAVRLTFVVDSTVYGGAEVYVAQLLRRLPARFAPTLLATEPLLAQLVEAAGDRGAPVSRFRSPRGKLDLPNVVAAGRALRRTAPDLVHVNLATPANNRHSIGLARVLGLRTVATLHLGAPITSDLQRQILRRAYRRLDRLVAVSEETRRQLCDELRVPEELVQIVPNGVEMRDPVRLRDTPRPLRVGGLGRLTEQKGFDLLVRAVVALAAEGDAVEAVIAGEGPERARLEELSGGGPVQLVGFVDDARSFLDGVDAFCLPSRWEGLPFALLEAMMAGLPCVAADVGDVAIALDGAGLVVPPEDVDALAAALRSLADSAERCREFGAAAHARAIERHSVERMVAETVRVYDEALR
jgi:glycosyltransferase involved in cell wall biosynthesis